MYTTRLPLFVIGVLVAAACYAATSSAQTLPGALQAALDTSYPVSSGAATFVAAGGDLQAALNAAQLGDTILLQAGATFSGSFTLPAKSGTGWIVIRTSASDSSLPPEGMRMTPAYAALLPKIVASGSAAALQTAAGAHHYRLVGIEFTVASGLSINYGVVTLGDGSSAQTALSQVPYSLILDRVWVHGQPAVDVSRGVALNCSSGAVIDSYISDIHVVANDSQAIMGWNGPGPFKIANNYLEGAAENVMFGGADPSIINLVPSDIEIRGNYVTKPVAWRASAFQIKNLLELKNARRVVIDGNVFENNWQAAQNGFAILFTVRNQDGTAPWSAVQDVTFTHNIVRHVASGVNLLGTDDLNVSQQTIRILIKDNLFDDVSDTNWGGIGRLFQPIRGTADVTIDHNTAFQTGDAIGADGPANTTFTYTNNLTPNNQYGVGGTNTSGNPTLTLTTYFPGAIFRRNILAGGNAMDYPTDNFFPATLAAVGFVDLAGGNYKLAASSAYKNAGLDGKDVGADIDAINASTAISVSGAGATSPAAPSSLAANATVVPTVLLSWVPIVGATYEIARSTGLAVFEIVGTSGTNAFTDIAVVSNAAYLYKVRAVDALGKRSAFSNLDLATTVTFTDDPLVAQSTVVKTQHITQLRTAVNAVRALAGLGSAPFMDPMLTSAYVIKAAHVSDLRNALDPARANLGLQNLSYTDSPLTGFPVKAIHIEELRNGVK
jgi:hypothetical protein